MIAPGNLSLFSNERDGRWLGRANTILIDSAQLDRGDALDPATVSGHSLRAGLATSVAKAGATERMIMKTTRHRSEAMVRRYIQSGTIFEDSAGHFLTKL